MQSHKLTKFMMEYFPVINAACKKYRVSISEFTSTSREYRIIDARREAAEILSLTGLTYEEIGALMNRDARSVELLLTRKRKREPEKHKHHEMHPDPALRDDSKRLWRDACEAGSKALLRAIFDTGTIYRPMSKDEIEAAKQWATSGNNINVEPKGWITDAPQPYTTQGRLSL